ncbi:MAG TPA: DinB family protein [Chitinophagaceae bacterium]|nr:DinB family protein [Chitinophagaceae bacterium]
MESAITQDLLINMVLAEWKKQNANLDKLLDTLSPEKWLQAIAPGKNRGIYLVGHLVAVNDGIAKFLGIGEKLYPQLEGIFLTNPDSTKTEMPSLSELRQYWTNINTRLEKYFSTMSAADWFSRHTAVSEEAFAKEPNRNKLNILINRTNHQSYHLGQLALLK